ncbi:MAG: RsmE family RNA methyltransferase [Patescibacteria group bacterium]
MHLQRFFGEFDLAGRALRVTDRELLSQWKNVLRLKAGDRVVLADGAGNESVAALRSFTKDGAEFDILERMRNFAEPARQVVLYCAILKRENFEFVAQKATEAGVADIVPLVTGRTVKLGMKLERLEKIIKEAAEQSGRGIVPRLRAPVSFQDAVDMAAEDGRLNLFFHTDGAAGLPNDISEAEEVNVWIGPEGGWDEAEAAAARFAEFRFTSLGLLTLRAETAAVIATYLVAHGE